MPASCRGASHPGNASNRTGGTSVFFAAVGGLKDVVVRLCGSGTLGTTDRSEYILATAAYPLTGSTSWNSLGVNYGQIPPAPRDHSNAVILPDGSILVIGGNNGATAVLPLALYRQGFGWLQLPNSANSPTPRKYHATIVLLPDGRVFVGGGEGRLAGSDYEIFSPHYLQGSPPPQRPKILSIAGTGVGYVNDTWELDNGHTGLTITCSNVTDLAHLARLVLIAPGSITHHADMTARYVELPSALVPGTSDQRLFQIPDNKTLPRG